MHYEIKHRDVDGLETSYEEWIVSFCNDDGNEVERIASFIHHGCAEGLRYQLQEAYEKGLADAAPPSTKDVEWAKLMQDAHDSMDRLEALALQRMAEGLDVPPDTVDWQAPIRMDL